MSKYLNCIKSGQASSCQQWRSEVFRPSARTLCHLNPSSVNIIKLSDSSKWSTHIRPTIPVHINFPEVPGEKDLNCLQVKPDLTSKYRALVDHFRIKTSGSLIDPKGVFANNELDLSEIDVYGFDYDCKFVIIS